MMLYAEDVGHYWKTGQSSPDTWVDKAKAEIVSVARDKKAILNEAYGKDGQGRAAFMLEFVLSSERFRLVWPVLPSRSGNERAAKIQAATMLYHDVKARCVTAKVLGGRAAFFTYLLLPDGRTAAQVAAPELQDRYPRLLAAPQEA
jgi:hypothetical protein